jgi:FkbM family methyltransferase
MRERETNNSQIIFFEKFFNIIDIFYKKRIINYIKFLEIDTVIDVGAHKGEFLSYVLKMKSIKRIYSFEPQIEINQALVKKFKNIKKIKIFNLALDKTISKKYIYINKLSSTSSLQTFNKKSLYLKFKNFLLGTYLNYIKKYKVRTNTIDNIFNNINLSKCLLKIDTEGYEINVLKGSQKTLDNKIKYILIENQLNNQHKKLSKVNIFDYLKNKNFKILKKFTHPTLSFQDVLLRKIN